MRKAILTGLLMGFISFAYGSFANAATVTFTKPTVQVNTSQEESALSKKMQEIEKKQAEAKAKQEQRQAEIKAKQEQRQAEAKAKQEQRQNAIKSFKDSFK